MSILSAASALYSPKAFVAQSKQESTITGCAPRARPR
jgi:hypothetical protein